MARKKKLRAANRKFIINLGDELNPRFVLDIDALARNHDERFARSWAKLEADLAAIAARRIERFRADGFTDQEIQAFLDEDRAECIARARDRGWSEEQIAAEYPPVTLTPAVQP